MKAPLTSGWVTKDDPVKEMKNEQERIRRGELAKYRENVKNMLPQLRELDKVATVTILEVAKVHCLELQNWVRLVIHIRDNPPIKKKFGPP